MRVWTVPFGELDNQRVLGQHVEIHMLWSLITKHHRKFMGWEDPKYRWYLWQVHRRIVEEMVIRGIAHHSPIDLSIEELRWWPFQIDALPTLESLAKDRQDLVDRWGGNYQGRIPMPSAYQPVLDAYREFLDGMVEVFKDARKEVHS
jgi:hypothetical protein